MTTSRASPSAITRMTCSSSAGRASLRRNPLAPARKASATFSSVSQVVRIRTCARSSPSCLSNAGRSVDPVERWHADIHQSHVGAGSAGQFDGFGARGGLADHRDVVLQVGENFGPDRTRRSSSASSTLMGGRGDVVFTGAIPSGRVAGERLRRTRLRDVPRLRVHRRAVGSVSAFR